MLSAKAGREKKLAVPLAAGNRRNAQPIAYSRNPGSRGYYQLNRWTERPSRRIHALLLERLRQSGAFEAVVGPAAGGLRGDLVLDLGFFQPARTGLTPQLLEPRLLMSGNGAMATAENAGLRRTWRSP